MASPSDAHRRALYRCVYWSIQPVVVIVVVVIVVVIVAAAVTAWVVSKGMVVQKKGNKGFQKDAATCASMCGSLSLVEEGLDEGL